MLFIVSAVLKMVGMDQFEIYIYSYHFFSLNFSFIVARLAIIVELVLGIMLLSNCLHKWVWWGCMAMLGGYTLLLIYALILGRTDNCHCFGEYLELDPKMSLVKNIVLILLFLFIYKMEGWKTPFRWLVFCLAVLASSIGVFVISPPDNLTSFSEPEQNLQMELFDAMLDDAPLDSLRLKEGKQVICFFSTGCEVCQMAAHKLSLMQQFYDFPPEQITCLFFGDEESVTEFYIHAESVRYRDVLYPDVARLLKAVSGNLPTIVFLDIGKVVHEYGFRNMNEVEIKAFMVSCASLPSPQ